MDKPNAFDWPKFLKFPPQLLLSGVKADPPDKQRLEWITLHASGRLFACSKERWYVYAGRRVLKIDGAAGKPTTTLASLAGSQSLSSSSMVALACTSQNVP